MTDMRPDSSATRGLLDRIRRGQKDALSQLLARTRYDLEGSGRWRKCSCKMTSEQLQRGLRTRIGKSLQPDLPIFGTEAPWSALYDVRRRWSPLSVC